MYTAGVTCEGCHTESHYVQVGEMTLTGKASGPKQCASCHDDEYYGEMLEEWQDEVRGWLGDLQEQLAEAEGLLPGDNAPEDDVNAARTALESARTKIRYVALDGSYGAHNYMYITTILDEAESELDDFLDMADQWAAAETEQPTGEPKS
jgi:hypothetical protein